MSKRNIRVHPKFVEALKEKFLNDGSKIPKRLTSWQGRFTFVIKKFANKDLNQYAPNLYGILAERLRNKKWPDPKTIERAYLQGEENNASIELLNLCGWYVFEEEWPQKRETFNVVEYEQQVSEQVFLNTLIKKYSQHPSFTNISIIGNSFGNIQQLDMGKCYTGLSYLELKELRDRDDYLWKEKEKTSFKKYINQNEIPHHIISQTVLSISKSTAIMGNPGVGKSTFAKWICFSWANQHKGVLEKEEIPLYFNLKELEFSGNNNPFYTYFIENYLQGETSQMSYFQELLTSKKDAVIFLFDGFDELTIKERKTFAQFWYRLYPANRFILFSRPYGLIDSPLKFNTVFEIIGFNKLARNNYIKEVFEINSRVEESLSLLTVLDKNPILANNSFNPLMLSYIVLLYLVEQSPDKLLLNINSIYELQDLIILWLKKHHQQKLINGIYFNEILEGAQKLAYDMEIHRVFLYRSKGSSEVNEKLCDQLSNIGIGRRYELEFSGNWKYYFTYVSIQEFLASKQIGPFINVAFFMRLLQDNYYWNFSKMILGYKSYMGDSDFVLEVIAKLQHIAYQEDNRIAINHIALLIGECSPNQLTSLFSEELIIDLLNNYIKFYADNGWRSIFLSSLQRAYSKLKIPQKRLFNAEVLNILNNVAERKNIGTIEYLTAKDYFPLLINRLELYNEFDFADGLIKILYQLLNTKNQQINNALGQVSNMLIENDGKVSADFLNKLNQYGNARQGIRISLFSLSQQIPPHILDFHQVIIEKIIEELQYDIEYTTDEIRLCAHFWKIEEILETYEHYKTKALQYLTKYNSTLSDEEILDDIKICCHQLGVYTYASIIKRNTPSDDQVNLMQINEAYNIISQFYDKNILSPKDDSVQVYLGETLIQTGSNTAPIELLVPAWLELKNTNIIDKVLSVFEKYKIEYYFKINNIQFFEEWIESFINTTSHLPLLDEENKVNFLFLHHLKIIRLAFYYTEQASFLLFKYLDEIFPFFQDLLKIYTHLTKLASNNVDSETNNDLEEVKNIIASFTDILNYDHTKRKFVELFLNHDLEKYTFLFNTTFIENILTDKIIFFNDALWNLCFQMLEKHNRLDIGIRILAIPNSYLIPSNFNHIKKIWSIMLNKEMLFFQNYPTQKDVFLEAINHTLSFLVVEQQVEKETILIQKLNRTILRKDLIKEVNDQHEERCLNHDVLMPYFWSTYILRFENEITQKGLDYYALEDNHLALGIGIELVEKLSPKDALDFAAPNNESIKKFIYQYLEEKGKTKALVASDFLSLPNQSQP